MIQLTAVASAQPCVYHFGGRWEGKGQTSVLTSNDVYSENISIFKRKTAVPRKCVG